MATHSSILAWRIPQTEEPGRLQSTGSHDLVTKQAAEAGTLFWGWSRMAGPLEATRA